VVTSAWPEQYPDRLEASGIWSVAVIQAYDVTISYFSEFFPKKNTIPQVDGVFPGIET
jgi:hypothetical protein